MLLAEAHLYAALGLVAATVASMFWAVSVVLYRRVGRIMPPVRLNMTKGFVACAILGGATGVQWLALGTEPWSLSPGLLALMALSGVIGIGLGDTLFFAGLNRMGSRRMLLLFTINPVITVLVAWAVLDEPLSLMQLAGIALTCGGVAWVIAERSTGKSDGHVDLLGILYGIGAASCQATGILMSRYVFDQGEMTSVSSAWLRITAAALALVLFLPLDRLLKDPGGQDHHHPAQPSKAQARAMFGCALMLGTVLGIWLMQIAVKQSDKVGIASTLLSTSPLFVLPIVAIMGERISRRAVMGACICIAGVAMLYVFSG